MSLSTSTQGLPPQVASLEMERVPEMFPFALDPKQHPWVQNVFVS